MKKPASEQVVAMRVALRDCLPSGTTEVVVGCSGGPDSLVLTAIASWVGQREGFTVHAVTVDHQLQPGSAEIARIANAHALTLGATSAEVVAVTVDQISGDGMESAARKARRTALASVAKGNPILLGHTADDQAETVLLRLLRGAGAHSLGAMSACDGLIHRPFLGIARTHIALAVTELLEPMGITPWSDPHNADSAFARVHMRTHLEQLRADFGPGIVAGLVRSAQLLRADDQALEQWADLSIGNVVFSNDSTDGAVEVTHLMELPEAVRTRVIRRIYEQVVGTERESSPLSFNHVAAINALVTNWRGQGEVALPSGASAAREYGRLRIYRT